MHIQLTKNFRYIKINILYWTIKYYFTSSYPYMIKALQN